MAIGKEGRKKGRKEVRKDNLKFHNPNNLIICMPNAFSFIAF